MTPTFQITHIDVGLLDDDPENPNILPSEKYRALVSFMQRVGFVQNCIVQDTENGRYRIRDGHHRLRAARELGMMEVPCLVLAAGIDARSYMLSMNLIRGELDLSLASNLIADLHNNGGWSMQDLLNTGFSKTELEDLLSASSEDPDTLLADGIPQEPIEEPQEEREAPQPKSTIIELEYHDSAEYKRVRAHLKKLGGGDLARGVSILLDQAGLN